MICSTKVFFHKGLYQKNRNDEVGYPNGLYQRKGSYSFKYGGKFFQSQEIFLQQCGENSF